MVVVRAAVTAMTIHMFGASSCESGDHLAHNNVVRREEQVGLGHVFVPLLRQGWSIFPSGYFRVILNQNNSPALIIKVNIFN